MTDVFELTSDGVTATSRLLYAAGSPEAEAFQAKYGDPDHPVDLIANEPSTTVVVVNQEEKE